MSEKNAEKKIKNILVFGATGTIGAAILKYI